jgi:phage baseplate assembly protein W
MAAADFGTSLRLTDGDLVFSEGSFQQVSGLPNLAQALTIRVLTPLGSDPFNPTYGFDTRSVFTQGVGSHLAKELVKLNLVRTLSADPRVREVLDIQFQAVDLARRGWRVEVTLATAAGQTSTLQLRLGV